MSPQCFCRAWAIYSFVIFHDVRLSCNMSVFKKASFNRLFSLLITKVISPGVILEQRSDPITPLVGKIERAKGNFRIITLKDELASILSKLARQFFVLENCCTGTSKIIGSIGDEQMFAIPHLQSLTPNRR